jgi:AmiR/NasT family two-component response regulator
MSNSLNQWSKTDNLGPADQRISDSPVVMVVEDEFLIRIMITDELRHAGYEVVECGTADEAIDVLRSGISIGVMFTDIRMPGSISGEKRPETLTGQFVPKPYSPRSVVHLIDALMGTPARALERG